MSLRFYCPVPYAIHPAHRRLDARSIDWLVHFQLYEDDLQRQRLCCCMPGLLAALSTPEAQEEPLQVVSDFLMWLYAFDDEYCEEGPFARQPAELAAVLRWLLRVAEAPESGARRGDRYAAALLDLRLRLAAHATPGQLARWLDALRAYFADQVWCAELRVRHQIPNLEDYVMLRLFSGSMGVTTVLPEIAGGYELSPHEIGSPAVRALREMTCAVVGWDNDIISHRKERERVGDGQNLLDVLMSANGYDLTAALTEAIAMRDRTMCRFLELRDDVRRGAGAGLDRYLADLSWWVRANIEWGLQCHRYVDTVLDIDYAQTATATGPLPMAAVRWWWDATLTPLPTGPTAEPDS